MKMKVKSKNKPKNVFVELISSSFKLPFQNPIIFVPSLIIAGLALIAASIFALATITFGFIISNVESLTTQIALFAIGTIIGLFIICSAGYALLVVFSGFLVMTKDIIHGNKTTMKRVWSEGKKFWLRYLLLNLITAVIILIPVLILGAIFLLLSLILPQDSIGLAIALVFAIILVVLFSLLFSLSSYYLIIENKKAIDAVKKSYEVAKDNYLFVLGIVVFFIVANNILTPFAPDLISLIFSWFISIVQSFAFMKFALLKK